MHKPLWLHYDSKKDKNISMYSLKSNTILSLHSYLQYLDTRDGIHHNSIASAGKGARNKR